jgi:hypothetical protein
LPINELKIKSAKPKGKRYALHDSNNLFLEVMPAGKKYWRARFMKDNVRQWRTFGMYPDISSPKYIVTFSIDRK